MLVFAHRGASAHAPENTLLAIDLALEQNADGIEVDVHQADNQLFVIHDRWLQRTTNGQGLIDQFTGSELNKLDAGLGQHIPTLEDVLQRINGRCFCNIEMKGIKNISLLSNTVDKALDQFNFTLSQLSFSSFDHHLLTQCHQQHPTWQLGALTACKPIDYACFAEKLNADSVNADVSFVDKAFVDDAHARGLKVFVYTVDEEHDMLMLQSWGVDGIFSNKPAFAKHCLL